MDIKWYKNPWYITTVIIALVIFLLAFISTKNYTTGIFVEHEDSTTLLYVETIFRTIFNPLWTIALWTFNKGQLLNAKRHKDILLNIQGALDSHDEEEMKVEKIYAIIYEYDDIVKRLKNKLSKTDNIEPGSGNPKI